MAKTKRNRVRFPVAQVGPAQDAAPSSTPQELPTLTEAEQKYMNLVLLRERFADRLQSEDSDLANFKADKLQTLTASLNVVGSPASAAVEQVWTAIQDEEKKRDKTKDAIRGVSSTLDALLERWESEHAAEALQVFKRRYAELENATHTQAAELHGAQSRLEELALKIQDLQNAVSLQADAEGTGAQKK